MIGWSYQSDAPWGPSTRRTRHASTGAGLRDPGCIGLCSLRAAPRTRRGRGVLHQALVLLDAGLLRRRLRGAGLPEHHRPRPGGRRASDGRTLKEGAMRGTIRKTLALGALTGLLGCSTVKWTQPDR